MQLHYPSTPSPCAQVQTSYSPLFSRGRKAIVPSEGKTVFQKRNGNVPPEKKAASLEKRTSDSDPTGSNAQSIS